VGYEQARSIEFMASIRQRWTEIVGGKCVHLRDWLPKGALAALMLILGLLRGDALAGSFLNNAAMIDLTPQWLRVSTESTPPNCQTRLSDSSPAWQLMRALALNADNQRIRLNYGRVLWLSGNCTEAIQTWEQSLALNSQDRIQAHITELALANSYFSAGLFEQARLTYRQIDNVNAILESYSRKAAAIDGKIEWAELSFLVDPCRSTAANLVSLYLHYGQKRKDDVLRIYQTLADVLPESNADHWWALGQKAQAQDDWATALRVYRTGINALPNPNCNLYRDAGLACEKLGDLPCAVEYYEKMIGLCPRSTEPYFYMGWLEQRRGNHEAALEWFRRAHDIAPDSGEPEYFQGQVLLQQNRLEEACARFEAAVLQEPQNGSMWYHLSVCRQRMGQLDLAISLAEKAVYFSPHFLAANLWLADLYLESGRRDDAVRVYKQVLMQWPEYPEALQRLATLNERP